LDDAAEVGVKGISFVSDGESTCNKHLYEAIVHGKANGIDMALGTNGYLLRDDKLEAILPCLTYLRFNMSGVSKYGEIHGCKQAWLEDVCNTVDAAVKIKRRLGLPVVIGLQMVLLPQYIDQLFELVLLGKQLGVDYVIAKHCSDNERGDLGVDYEKYAEIFPQLEEAEALSDDKMTVAVKWSKIRTGKDRKYSRCWGPPLMLQMSGSGLVAPCGSFFADEYSRYHIGNIQETRFRDIVQSDRYWEVMRYLRSEEFDAKTQCASLCLQDKVNAFLCYAIAARVLLPPALGEEPYNVNFL
jgi:MoaA/NifB/PqqE/SkfB family radical SAM enzyme